jgi:hypothetical protein
MKRLLFVVVLMLCLCFPAFAGHTIPGDWCECGSFAGCICDPGEQGGSHSNRSVPDDSKPDDSKQDAPISLGSETLLVLAALFLLLRYKA